MNLREHAWLWEGQAIHKEVWPPLMGVGEGCKMLGIDRARFLFHATTPHALERLSFLKELRVDITKWLPENCGPRDNGVVLNMHRDMQRVCDEAEHLSRLSLDFPNVTGAFYDDMKEALDSQGLSGDALGPVREAARKHNPDLLLETVVYARDLDDAAFWRAADPHIDAVSFWFWGAEKMENLEDTLARARDMFGERPITMGCYMRDYANNRPMPIEWMQRQFEAIPGAIEKGLIDGFEIIAACLIDQSPEQTAWIKDFLDRT